MRQPATDAGANRRDFLAASTTGAIALGTGAFASGVHAAGAGTIKIGMIGCGERCSGAAFQAMKAGPDVRLVAMGDIFRDRLDFSRDYLKRELPEQVRVDADHCFVGFEGYKHVIEAADVVLIACASKFHPMYAEAAIRAGKHVFVEKPHGIDPVGVRRMQAVRPREGEGPEHPLGPAEPPPPGLERDRQADPRRRHRRRGRHPVHVPPRAVPAQPARPQPERDRVPVPQLVPLLLALGRRRPPVAGHNMDRVAWILKEETPKWAFGLAGRSASFGEIFGDMFDHHTVVYEYSSGARVYALCRTQEQCYGNSSDIIMGTKGTCHLGSCKIEGKTPWKYSGPHNDPYLAEQKALIDSVRAGTPINSGYHMNNSTLAGVLGQMACYTGGPITWDEAARSPLQYGPCPEASNFDTKPPTLPDTTGNYPLPRPGVTRLDGRA